jgi:hypothetical protein
MDALRLFWFFEATCAVWWSGTRMAEQYIREFGEQVNHSPAQASHESPTQTRRNQ